MRSRLFRTADNAPISSMYTLYANGRGETYWAASVRPENLSTVSTATGTAITANNSTLSTYINYLQLSHTNLSTSVSTGFSLQTGSLLSTSISFQNSLIIQNNNIIDSSNFFRNAYETFSNSATARINSVYTSTINIMYSTINAISSISTFTAQISSVEYMTVQNYSSLSTLIQWGDTYNFSTLSSVSYNQMLFAVNSSVLYIGATISSISSILATTTYTDERYRSSINALLSTSASLQTADRSSFSTLYNTIKTNELSTISSQSFILSTLGVIDTRLVNLENTSTNLALSIVSSISSYTTPLIASVDTKYSVFTSTLLEYISTVGFSTLQNNLAISSLSSYTSTTFSYTNSTVFGVNARLSTVERNLAILTTSSILAGVYDTFNELENYTTQLIVSTVNATTVFRSSLQVSTYIQNTSTATGFFNYFLSTVYLSTVSTVVPMTYALTSTLVSTLLSTGTSSLTAIFNSSIWGYSDLFIRTTSSQTSTILSSMSGQIDSSIISYLSVPTAAALIAFNINGTTALSSFSTNSGVALASQSTIFWSTFIVNQTAQSTLTGNSISILTSLSTTNTFYNAAFSTSLALFSISTVNTFASQNAAFTSNQNLYAAQNQSNAASTNSAVLLATSTAAVTTLINIQTDTTATYNTFVAGLNASASTAALSSLYTVQNATLWSNNFEVNLDMATFRNFYINISTPLVNGSSNYRIGYTSNVVSNLDYRQGIITVDVNTAGSGYSNNSGRLCLDTYRWGIPTTVFGEVYPTISSSDYTAMYSYTIMNSIVYTNLLNVYPRLRIQALALSGTQAYNVFVGATAQSNIYWRGSRVNITWSNYSQYPFGALGAPPYAPEVLVDVIVSNTVYNRYGPYPLTTTTAAVNVPYITGTVSCNAIPTTVRTYIVGKPMEAQTIALTTLIPQFTNIRITPESTKFLALQEFQARNDSGTNVIPSATVNLYGAESGNSNMSFLQFGGAIRFASPTNSMPYLRMTAGDADFQLGTGDFTVEWFQYMTTTTIPPSGFYPRIFSLGTYYTAAFSFSLETVTGGITNRPTLYIASTSFTWTDLGSGIYNTWRHFAITRSGTSVRLYVNGVLIDGAVKTSAGNIADGSNEFTIGNESTRTTASAFPGYIANFNFVKGTAFYTGGSLLVPTAPLPVNANSKLLLYANSLAALVTDSSPVGKTVTNVGTTFGGISPFASAFTKANVNDGNPGTIVIGPATANAPDPQAYLEIIPPSGNTISNVTISNIGSSCNIMLGGSGNGATQLGSSVMLATMQIGAIEYRSTIYLTTATTQSYRF